MVIGLKEKEIGNLISTLYRLFPNGKTINKEDGLPLETLSTEHRHYHRLLTHFITLINQKDRMREHHSYITERSDIIASLNLLDMAILRSERGKEQRTQELYKELSSLLPDSKESFSRRGIEKLLNLPKTTVHTYIHQLEERGFIERVGGHKNTGYRYRLK